MRDAGFRLAVKYDSSILLQNYRFILEWPVKMNSVHAIVPFSGGLAQLVRAFA